MNISKFFRTPRSWLMVLVAALALAEGSVRAFGLVDFAPNPARDVLQDQRWGRGWYQDGIHPTAAGFWGAGGHYSGRSGSV